MPNPNKKDAYLEATIQIWDFGGQETYHGTHRIFAAADVGSGPYSDLRYDVAQSVRGVQVHLAHQLEVALRHIGGVETFFYTTDTSSRTIDDVYNKIQTARIQVIWLSAEYLENSVENQFSLIELARAIWVWQRARGASTKWGWENFRFLLPNDSGRVVLIYLNNSVLSVVQKKTSPSLWMA